MGVGLYGNGNLYRCHRAGLPRLMLPKRRSKRQAEQLKAMMKQAKKHPVKRPKKGKK